MYKSDGTNTVLSHAFPLTLISQRCFLRIWGVAKYILMDRKSALRRKQIEFYLLVLSEQLLSISPSYRLMHQHLVMMTERSTTSTNNSWKPLTKHQRRTFRRWTWHSPDGKHHNQVDYILVKKRFRSGVKIHRTRSFPEADIGSDHDLVMMTFRVRLKKAREPIEKLRDSDVACTFQATIGGKFAPLIGSSHHSLD